MFELTTLMAVIHKARVVEKNKAKYKKKQPQQALWSQFIGKKPSYTSPSVRNYGQGSCSRSKKQALVKQSFLPSLTKDGSEDEGDKPKVECRTCFG